MAKYLRILPSSRTTVTDGPILLDPNLVLYVQAQGDNTLNLFIRNLDSAQDNAVITFSTSDSTRFVQRQFINELCNAASDAKSGTYYDLPPLITAAGASVTITSITFS